MSMLVCSAYREDRSVRYSGILVEWNAFVLTRSDSQNGPQAKDKLVSIADTASKSCTKTAPEPEYGDCGGMGWGEGRGVSDLVLETRLPSFTSKA